MSTTNDPPKSRQTALHDDSDSNSTESRTRARAESFAAFIDYYDCARVRDARRLAADPDHADVASFTIERQLGNGTRTNLVECPIAGCHAPFNPGESAAEHFFAEHQPSDLGLTPIQTAREDRTRHPPAVDDGQATLSDY